MLTVEPVLKEETQSSEYDTLFATNDPKPLFYRTTRCFSFWKGRKLSNTEKRYCVPADFRHNGNEKEAGGGG